MGERAKAASLTSCNLPGPRITAGLFCSGGMPRVLLVCRADMRGLTTARSALTQWASGAAPPVDLLGLAVLADAPGKTPKALAGLRRPRRRRSPTVLDAALGRSLAAHGDTTELQPSANTSASLPTWPPWLHTTQQPLKGLTMNTFSALQPASFPTRPHVVPAQAGGLLTILNWASGIGLVLGVLGVIIVGIGMVIQLRAAKAARPSASSAGSSWAASSSPAPQASSAPSSKPAPPTGGSS
jgi:hypothetical protein